MSSSTERLLLLNSENEQNEKSINKVSYISSRKMPKNIIDQIEKEEEDLKKSSERFRHPKSISKSTENESGEINRTNPKKLIFQDIEAVVKTKNTGGEQQTILRKISGVARPGELTFIMGSSGAGKTTLLNILTGRNLKNIETNGSIYVNNRFMIGSEMRKISAYVQQDDVFISNLTVKETLLFSAQLRSPKHLNENEKQMIVDDLILMMGLKKCENTRVGSIIQKSLSRGERKRLAFACEILTDPPILFCDEPTSGLDSFMSQQVVKSLRKLTKEGKTVICTIHQPSTSVFHMADSLILLAQGQIVYQGPAKKVDEFFANCGFPIPQFVSSPDHFMAVTSHQNYECEDDYRRRIKKIASNYEQMKINESISSTKSTRTETERQEKFYARSWWCQFYYIFDRSIVQTMREKSLIITKLLQTVLMAFMAGLIYFNLKNHADHLQSFKGFAFFSVQMMHLLFLIPSMMIFGGEFPIVIREYQSNMYSPSAYFFAKTTADVIQYSIYPLVFTAILWSLIGLEIFFDSLLHYILIMLLLTFCATGLSHCVASAIANLPTAMTVVVMIALPFMVFGGFLIDFDSIPTVFQPISWLSWYKYGYEAVVVSYYRNIDLIPGCNQTMNLLTAKCSTGRQFIIDQAILPDYLWFDYLFLIATTLVFKIAGVFLFVRKIKNT